MAKLIHVKLITQYSYYELQTGEGNSKGEKLQLLTAFSVTYTVLWHHKNVNNFKALTEDYGFYKIIHAKTTTVFECTVQV